jgi:hypothetical protein
LSISQEGGFSGYGRTVIIEAQKKNQEEPTGRRGSVGTWFWKEKVVCWDVPPLFPWPFFSQVSGMEDPGPWVADTMLRQGRIHRESECFVS